MQWRGALLAGLALCAAVGLLAAVPTPKFHSDQANAGPVASEPRDSRNLSSLSVYDPNPNHLWNRLFRQLYVRKAWDDREYGADVLDPLLWGETHIIRRGASGADHIEHLFAMPRCTRSAIDCGGASNVLGTDNRLEAHPI